MYAGSLATGAVWAGDLRTGEGTVLVPGAEGRVAAGLKYSAGLPYVSGGPTDMAYAYGADTGADVAAYQLGTPGASFVNRLPLAAVLLAGVAGAVVGDSVGYLVGRRYGRRLLLALPRRVVTPAHVARTEESITRLGGRAVFVGRFTAALRALVPGLAGMARMQYSVFLRVRPGAPRHRTLRPSRRV